MRVFWEPDGIALYGATSPGGYRLIVEQLPETVAWDWAIWREGAQPQRGSHGKAASAENAMTAAERTIDWLDARVVR